jgi:hypothetical protein
VGTKYIQTYDDETTTPKKLIYKEELSAGRIIPYPHELKDKQNYHIIKISKQIKINKIDDRYMVYYKYPKILQ